MAIVSFDRVSPADAARDAFAARAYAGDMPRTLWIDAQRLVAEYDDATSGERRALVIDAMRALEDRARAPLAAAA